MFPFSLDPFTSFIWVQFDQTSIGRPKLDRFLVIHVNPITLTKQLNVRILLYTERRICQSDDLSDNRGVKQ